jgi:F0F1-type ATP synthase membrane subunit b/b'
MSLMLYYLLLCLIPQSNIAFSWNFILILIALKFIWYFIWGFISRFIKAVVDKVYKELKA